jgi:hypothetical protein
METDFEIPPVTHASNSVSAMKNALSAHFSDATRGFDGLVSARDNSNIYHATIHAPVPFDAAVKQCLVPQTDIPDALAAQEQYAALERVHTAFENLDSRYRVPTPLHLSSALAAYAMSWVEGESLSKKLRSPLALLEGQAWLRDAGAWLGHFHNAGPRRCQAVGADERLTDAGNYDPCAVPEKAFSSALRVLNESTPLLKQMVVEVAWLHGDCKADNFILTGQGIYGIDISLCDENPVEYDLAMFFNNLGLLLSGPQYIHVRAMQSRFEQAFWQGYRLFGPPVSQVYLDWTRLNFLLSQWHTMLIGQRPRINTWILNCMFSNLTTRLSRTVDRDHHPLL